MNYKPAPKLLDWYFQDKLEEWVFEIKPESKARLTEKFTEDSIPESIHEDLIWIWGYMKSKYKNWYDAPRTDEETAEQNKREFKRKNVAEIYDEWNYDRTLSALFHQDEITNITIEYNGVNGKFPGEKRVLDTDDFIRFVCEAVERYDKATSETIGSHFKMQALKANDINYYKEKDLNSDGIDLEAKRDDAKRIYWFLKKYSSELSDRAIFRFGAWLMFDSGVKFKDAYETTGEWKESFEDNSCSDSFRFWAGKIKKKAKPQKPFSANK